MRIAEIAPPWFTVPPSAYGGIELVVSQLTDRLVLRGHDVTLFASGGSHTKADLVTPLLDPPDPALVTNAWANGPLRSVWIRLSVVSHGPTPAVLVAHASAGAKKGQRHSRERQRSSFLR